MQELIIRSQSGKDVTTSLLVAEVFGKRHDHVVRDIESLSCSRDFRITNFGETPYVHPQNGQTYHYYEITKDGFSFLAMGYTGIIAGAFKEKFINEFNKKEALLKNDDYILARSQEILTRRLSEAENKINNLQSKIEEDAPKTLVGNAISESSDSILVGELAKILKQNGINTGEQRLFNWLRLNGYLISRDGSDQNMPTQRSMEMRLFEICEKPRTLPSGEVRICKTSRVTGKGQVYFLNKFLKQQKAA